MTSSPSHVLIIDDDETTRLVLGDLVRRVGQYTVLEAADGAAGLAVAHRARPDLILLDLMMPNMDGFAVCTAIRADPHLREVPIFVLSAAEHTKATVQALEAGADDFLRKPCDLAELRAKIATSMRLNRFRALAQERERLRWLLDRSVEPLIVANASGQLTFANRRAREVFGLPEGEGCDVDAAVARNFRAEPADAWTQLRSRKFQSGPDFTVFQPENDYLASRWFKVELCRNDLSPDEVLLKFTDQTGVVLRELETWAFQRMISHKIRTPLNGVANVLDLVAASGACRGDDETASLLDLACQSAHRLERSLLDMVSYHQALFQTGLPAAPGTAPSLRELVDAVGEETGIARVALTDEERLSLAPKQMAVLRPVLIEIFENYAKFSDAPAVGLSLTLAAGVDGFVELQCFAPGAVPPPEAIARLGRPYWQAERRFTGEVPGMGLGLATARLLLHSRGGDLRCAACEQPAGLVTTISLPAETAAPPPERVASLA